MSTAQVGIFQEDSKHYQYLEYKLHNETCHDSLRAKLSQILSAEFKAQVVIAFSPKLTEDLLPNLKLDSFAKFEEMKGVNNFTIPATDYDLFFWVHSVDQGDVWDASSQIDELIRDFADERAVNTGFTYHDSRDLTGFVDGSANPKEEKRFAAALIPEGQAGEAGSFVLTQKWQHKLAKFNSLSQNQQEKVIGRTKPDSIELEGDAMPPTSHVSRTDVKLDGVAQKIYRRSAPYSSDGEHGLYFLSFACEQSRFDIQLQRMMGMTGDGHYDHLMHYSSALSSAYYFAPSQELLKSV